MRNRGWSFLWLAARVFVGAIFFYSGFAKLSEPLENFQGIMSQYELLPQQIIPLTSALLPWLEFILGALLILGYAPRLTAACLMMLTLGFLALLGASELLSAGLPSSCGCFGEGGFQVSPHQMFFLDLANFLLLAKLVTLGRHALSLDNALRPPD